jgi:hypothetical protein
MWTVIVRVRAHVTAMRATEFVEAARARRVGVPHRPLQLGWWTWAFPAIVLALRLVCVGHCDAHSSHHVRATR